MSSVVDCDVLVLGLGCAGSAAIAECASRGLRAVGIEQFEIAHDRGSSHGESRIFRIAYYEHPDYVPLLQRALVRWGDIEREAGRTLLHRCGGVWFGRPGSPLICDTANAARRHDLPHDLITDRAIIKSRFPAFALPDDFIAFCERDAGALRPEEAIRAFIDIAHRRGAAVRVGERVITWQTCGDDSVSVQTDRCEYTARRLIITAGAWACSVIGGDLPRLLKVTRQPVAWFEVRHPGSFAPDRFPCWAVEKNAHAFYYGFPIVAGGRAMKVSVHEVRDACDAETVNRTVSDREIRELREAVDRILPGVIGDCARTSVCMYTNSPDRHFMIGPHPDHPNVIVATGFSGHGFKFAPVLGEALADFATDGKTDLPIAFLSLKRFD